jgi:hypothetical protein
MIRRFITTAAALVIFSGVGHAAPPEYNNSGRDMYGNTALQNEAIQLRGAQEKARFAQETSSKESAEDDGQLRFLIPGAVLMTVVAFGVAVAYRIRG